MNDSLEKLLLELHAHNVRLWLEDGRLRYKAPKGALTPALVQAMAAHKTDLLALLQQGQAQQQWLQGEALEKKLNDWRQKLADVPSLLQLPTDRPRPLAQSRHNAHYAFVLPETLSEALKRLSPESGTTLSTTLLTAFATLLFRYSGQTDLLLGSLSANRAREKVKSPTDFLSNALLLHINLALPSHGITSGSRVPNLQELRAQIQQVALEAQHGQALPFDQLIAALHPERPLSHHPLVQVVFVWQNAAHEPLVSSGVDVILVAQSDAFAQFDLTLEMGERGTEIVGNWIYSTDLFDETTVRRMTGHLQTLLEGAVANPLESVERLPLLTAAERELILAEWNKTSVDHPLDKCVHEIFEARVAQHPSAVAVIYGDTQLTYRELNEQANQLAHYLIEVGVGPEDLVGVFVERSLDVVVAMLAIFKAGGAYLPLDPTHPPERLAFMLEDTQASLLLTQQKWLVNLPPHGAKVIRLDAEQSIIAAKGRENPARKLTSDQLAYVIYTSGSTGKPKGVAVEHCSLTNMTQNDICYLKLTPADRLTQFFSLSFDASIGEILCPLCAGSRLYILTEEQVLHGPALLELLKTQAITHLFLTPSVLATLSTAVPADFPALKAVFAAGEACTPDLVKQWSTGRHFYNVYGPTEFTIAATICECTPDDVPPPIGRVYDNCQAYVLDQHLQPVPIGVTGELYLGGVQVARGYLNRPELTEEKFIPNPFGSGRLYKTDDLVYYRPDGNIVFVGRVDGMVKVRGLRIELGEIEAALNAHPAVQQAVVSTVKDASGRDQHLVAYVVPVTAAAINGTGMSKGAVNLTSAELNHFAGQKLPAFMTPSAFIFLAAFPLTPSGKVDRRALPAPNLDSLGGAGRTSLVAPRTATEETIADIWCKLLQLEQVGIDENFFDLGGHSIMATQVASRMQKAFGVEIPVLALFEQHTIAGLANLVDAKILEQTSDNLLARLLAEVDVLSSNEVKQQLARQ